MTYAGFDRADCPPLDMMARLKKETNLEWCGFYLPAPSQSGVTWRGKRAALTAQGWGFAPIFVGQQVTGPGSKNVTTTQGAADGVRACADMKAEGFPAGSWVYLDLENGPPFTTAQRGYVGAWIDAVRAGGFNAGVYCSYLFAGEVAALRQGVRLWVFHVQTVSPHPVSGKAFPTPDMKACGYPQASIWQRDDEARLWDFGQLACDLDVSIMRDPSAPDAVGVNVASATTPAASPVAPPLVASPAPAKAAPPPASLWSRFWSAIFGPSN